MKVERIVTRVELMREVEVREKVEQEVGYQLRKALLEARKEFKRLKHEKILALDRPTRVDINHAAHAALTQGISKIGECINTQRFETKIVNPILDHLGQQRYEKSEEYKLEKMYKRIVESCDIMESNQSKEEEQVNEVKKEDGGKNSESAERVEEVKQVQEEIKEVVEIKEEVIVIEEVVEQVIEEVVQKPSPEKQQTPVIQTKPEPEKISPANIFSANASNPPSLFPNQQPQPVFKPANPFSNFFKTEESKPANLFSTSSPSFFGASLSQAAQAEPKKQETAKPLGFNIFKASKPTESANLFSNPTPVGSLFKSESTTTQKPQASSLSSCFSQPSKDKKTTRII